MDVDLRAVQIFIAVVEAGSLRAAAARLDISQPALTKIVRRLEDQTGVPLLLRSASGVSLTAFGETFLRHGRLLLATWSQAGSELRAMRAGAAGTIRIGAGPSWHRILLPRAIALFRADHPQVRLTVRHGEDRTLKEMLRAGMLDLVVAALPDGGHDADLDGMPLIRDPYRIFARHDHPLQRQQSVRLDETLAWPWLLSPPGTLIRERLAALFQAHRLPPPEPVVETDIVPFRLALMAEGPYLTCHAGERMGEGGEPLLLPLAVAAMLGGRDAGVLTRRGVEPNPAAAALAAMIARACAETGQPASAP
ncbi:MAG TPA: LysR substrate-binding domain-containing protein [Geminicoccaceae bacterium]|nr:LysR substrate-binding domain-containing protein [Geminicoccus sp.]HMU51364.1 LysR substrate-binding domain-containing protein [Geminicoccaceae bacterium]